MATVGAIAMAYVRASAEGRPASTARFRATLLQRFLDWSRDESRVGDLTTGLLSEYATFLRGEGIGEREPIRGAGGAVVGLGVEPERHVPGCRSRGRSRHGAGWRPAASGGARRYGYADLGGGGRDDRGADAGGVRGVAGAAEGGRGNGPAGFGYRQAVASMTPTSHSGNPEASPYWDATSHALAAINAMPSRARGIPVPRTSVQAPVRS